VGGADNGAAGGASERGREGGREVRKVESREINRPQGRGQ
jgi:hypothetical protein